MGKLTVSPPGSYEEAGKFQCLHVNMDYFANSNKHVLMTWGAGPCINIIVNDGNAKRGALSHIWNSSLNQKEIYDKAIGVIKEMWNAVGEPGSGEIYLFAGRAFKIGSPLVTKGMMSMDFSDYVASVFNNKHLVFDYTSTTSVGTAKKPGVYTGDLAYVPIDQKVFLLDDAELSALQGNMTTKGTQKISTE
jgi:hypothetical protein